jgi:hypothetical protein
MSFKYTKAVSLVVYNLATPWRTEFNEVLPIFLLSLQVLPMADFSHFIIVVFCCFKTPKGCKPCSV